MAVGVETWDRMGDGSEKENTMCRWGCGMPEDWHLPLDQSRI